MIGTSMPSGVFHVRSPGVWPVSVADRGGPVALGAGGLDVAEVEAGQVGNRHDAISRLHWLLHADVGMVGLDTEQVERAGHDVEHVAADADLLVDPGQVELAAGHEHVRRRRRRAAAAAAASPASA